MHLLFWRDVVTNRGSGCDGFYVTGAIALDESAVRVLDEKV